MKKFVVAGFLVIFWFAPARSADKTPDTHDVIAEEILKSFDKFSDILVTIKDKKTADEAKPKIESLGKTMAGLKKRADKLGEPGVAKKEELEKKYKSKLAAATKKLTGELIRIGSSVDGGQEVVKDISNAVGFAGGSPNPKAKDKK